MSPITWRGQLLYRPPASSGLPRAAQGAASTALIPVTLRTRGARYSYIKSISENLALSQLSDNSKSRERTLRAWQLNTAAAWHSCVPHALLPLIHFSHYELIMLLFALTSDVQTWSFIYVTFLLIKQYFDVYLTESCCSCWINDSLFKLFSYTPLFAELWSKIWAL